MKRILIAEDEPHIVLSLKFLMAQAGYAIDVVADGQAALDALNLFQPHLILLDVAMPLIDGMEVCRRIRATAEFAHIKIVMLTAHGSGKDVEKGLSMGANAYITKPFSTTELVQTVRKLVG